MVLAIKKKPVVGISVVGIHSNSVASVWSSLHSDNFDETGPFAISTCFSPIIRYLELHRICSQNPNSSSHILGIDCLVRNKYLSCDIVWLLLREQLTRKDLFSFGHCPTPTPLKKKEGRTEFQNLLSELLQLESFSDKIHHQELMDFPCRRVNLVHGDIDDIDDIDDDRCQW